MNIYLSYALGHVCDLEVGFLPRLNSERIYWVLVPRRTYGRMCMWVLLLALPEWTVATRLKFCADGMIEAVLPKLHLEALG